MPGGDLMSSCFHPFGFRIIHRPERGFGSNARSGNLDCIGRGQHLIRRLAFAGHIAHTDGTAERMAVIAGTHIADNPAIPQDFSIGTYEITFEEYDAYAKDQSLELPKSEWGRGKQPVIWVSWTEAKAYTEWLSRQIEQDCRLPTEEEWEYAARANGKGEYGLGQDGVEITQENLGEYAWYGANSASQTHEIGQKKPNAWGLYDMLGNVWEWTGMTSDSAAIRGGAWFNAPDSLRASVRYWGYPGPRYDSIGFRVVCVPHR